jgi:hypothetical protein
LLFIWNKCTSLCVDGRNCVITAQLDVLNQHTQKSSKGFNLKSSDWFWIPHGMSAIKPYMKT